MVPIEDLKKIVVLEFLTDQMLEKLTPSVESVTFKEREIIFDEGTEAETFYMLKTGKVLLEKRISTKMTASLGAIKPGYSFGWSAMFKGQSFSFVSVCAENSEVLTIKAEKLLSILNDDHSMGFLVMQRLLRMMKNRLDRLEEQFLRAIREHPDIESLIME